MADSPVRLQLMMGPTVPVPVPRKLAESLENVEVTQSSGDRCGFQLTFAVTHSGPMGLLTDVLLNSPLFEVFNRVVIILVFKGQPQVLVDGFITNQEHQPGEQPGTTKLTLTGEDVSLMMDHDVNATEYPAQDDHVIAMRIIGKYIGYGVVPHVIPPGLLGPPLLSDGTPVKAAGNTDLAHLRDLAEQHGYRFYISPGPAPLTSMAYWGPPIRVGVPQKALSVNMGSHSNVENINFQHNALAPALVEGLMQDARTNTIRWVRTFGSLRPPLASSPVWQVMGEHLRKKSLRLPACDSARAQAKAQAITDNSMDKVLTATGELDVMRYGAILQPRSLVGLRGAGLLYDGLYEVQEVTHSIQRGAYKQRFTLGREGLGTTTPVVRP